jgi:uncharacterized protein
MNDRFVPRAGAVFSADIAVPEHEREVRFYARVLSTGKNPLWQEHDLMNNLGMPIIGLGERSDAYAELPLQWMPHIQVADVAESVQRAVELGGSVLMHNQEDDVASQWAVLADPHGAAFGLITVIPAEALPPVDAPADQPVGRIAWLDLTVADASAARDFYRDVVGWSVQDVAMNDAGDHYSDYNMTGDDGTPAAGVCHARGVNATLPPVWMIYLPVGDLDESLRRVRDEGGAIISASKGRDGAFVYAAIRDPVGACLALVPAS